MFNQQYNTPSRPYVFEILKNLSGQYWWRLKSGNGEILCHSETYTTYQAARDTVEKVKQNAGNANISG